MKSNIEFQSLKQIEQYQEKRLAEQLTYLSENSPFYRELFAKNKIDIAQINSLAMLEQIPTTSKDDFSERNMDFLCVPLNKVIDYSTTSGSTGNPVTVPLTEKDIERLAYNEQCSFTIAGAKPGDVFQLMLTIDRQFMAGLAYFLGIRKLGAGIIRTGPASAQVQWDSIKRFKPNSIVAVPSFILKLIDYAEANDIDLNKSGIEKAICIGEAVRNVDLAPNTLAKRITDKWNIQLFSTYASTEMQTAFTECADGKGAHHQPELIIIEIVDDAGKQLKAGEFGEVTITVLGVEGTPLLRYRTGDICCYYDEPCSCGRNTIRLSPVMGRKYEMIKYKGTTIFPNTIYEALREVKEVKDYLIEIKRNDIDTDEITIHIYHDGERGIVQQNLHLYFKQKLRAIPTVNFVTEQRLQELKATGTRKPPSIIFR